MTTTFIIHPEIIDPTTGRNSNNLIEPEQDGFTSGPKEEILSEFWADQVLDVQIVTTDGHWNSVATVNDIYNDEFGTLLGVNVNWGRAVLVA